MRELSVIKEAQKIVEVAHYPNVQGTYIGYKVRKGKQTKQLAVIVCVDRKLPENQLRAEAIIPRAINISGENVETDVIQSGKFKALELIDDGRPVVPGYSIGHPDVTAGTLGFFAKRNGKRCLVTNAHVGANTNKGKLGDPIYYPGPYDGGTEKNTIGHLVATIPIEMVASNCPIAKAVVNTFNFLAKTFKRKSRLPPPVRQVANQVDCCTHELIEGLEIDERVYKIGKPTGMVEAELGMKAKKSGRTTEYTEGEITGINGRVQVFYGDGIAIFENQIMSDIPSDGGDSGSAVFGNGGNNLVGLLFAGGEGTTIMNRIQTVFDELGLDEID